MKLRIEWVYLIFIAVVIILSITWITPRSDNYSWYYVSREFLRNPSFLWSPVDDFRSFVLANNETNGLFKEPPLTMFLYSALILLNLQPILLITISFIIIIFFTYKMNNKAVPLLFISFLFLRSVIQGESDIFIAALTLSSVYFFYKKPILSGVFAALAFLAKQTGAFAVVWFILSVLIFKRRELKPSIKNVHVLSIVVLFLLISIWITRNFILIDGDIIGIITGHRIDYIKQSEQILREGIQVNQPETYFIDTTGYYPNPIDLLLVVGVIFLFADIYKKRKIDYLNFFALLAIMAYATAQIFTIKTLMTIRYYLFAFPIFAILVANNLKEKYFKCAMIIIIAIFIFYISSLQKYSFNQLKEQIDTVCPQIKSSVYMKPVYVDFFHHIFLAYECDLNLTNLIHSEYTVNLTSGSVYPTNKTTS